MLFTNVIYAFVMHVGDFPRREIMVLTELSSCLFGYVMHLLVINARKVAHASLAHTANLCTNIMDFRGLDSSTILMLRGGILMSVGNLPERLSQAILVGIMLV